MSYDTAFKRQQPRNDDEESLSVPYILIRNTPLESFIVNRIQETLSVNRGRSVKPGKQAERTRTLRKSLILTLPPRWKWWALSRTTSNCEPRCTFPPLTLADPTACSGASTFSSRPRQTFTLLASSKPRTPRVQ